MRRWAHYLTVVTLLFTAVACDSVSPVAPEGTVLSVSISPTFIDLTGAATVTVVARESSGQPVNPGVEVFFGTTLGLIDEKALTDESGVAVATLQGDGRPGEAIITVTSGAAAAVVSDPVQIGAFAALISLQATPTVVGTDGGEIDLLALVRDDRGSLLPNAVVNFGAEFGLLDSGGAGLITNANGEARDVLEVTSADAAAAGTSFVVSAQTAGEEGTAVEQTFTITIARLEPIAIFTASSGGSNVVVFNNQSTGAEPLKFAWDFTDNGTTDSTQRNPTHDYVNPGVYRVRLTVSNEFGSDTAIATLSVPL